MLHSKVLQLQVVVQSSWWNQSSSSQERIQEASLMLDQRWEVIRQAVWIQIRMGRNKITSLKSISHPLLLKLNHIKDLNLLWMIRTCKDSFKNFKARHLKILLKNDLWTCVNSSQTMRVKISWFQKSSCEKVSFTRSESENSKMLSMNNKSEIWTSHILLRMIRWLEPWSAQYRKPEHQSEVE